MPLTRLFISVSWVSILTYLFALLLALPLFFQNFLLTPWFCWCYLGYTYKYFLSSSTLQIIQTIFNLINVCIYIFQNSFHSHKSNIILFSPNFYTQGDELSFTPLHCLFPLIVWPLQKTKPEVDLNHYYINITKNPYSWF